MRFAILLLWASLCATLCASDVDLDDSNSSLLSGLRAYWRLEELAQTRYDSSSYGNHLTAVGPGGAGVGGPTGIGARVGYGASFVGFTNYLSAIDSPSLSFGDSEFSMAGWVALWSTNTLQSICSKRNAGGGTWNLYFDQASQRFTFRVYGAGGSVAGTVMANTFAAPSLYTTNFIFAAHSAASNMIYISINGGTIDSASTTAALVDDNTSVLIGSQSAGTAGYLIGKLDEIGLWGRILSFSEIATLFNGVTWKRFQPINVAPSGPFEFTFLDRSAHLGGHSQGVAYDGTYYYWSDSESVNKYTRNSGTGVYTLVLSRNVMSDTPTNKTQINGMTLYNNYLWVGANNYPTTTPKAGWILQYDPVTLTNINSYSVGTNWCEGGAWKDVGNGAEFFAVYTDIDNTRKYDAAFNQTGSYLLSLVQGQTHIISTRGLYQGATWIDDLFLCQLHCIDLDVATHVYKWTGSGFTPVQIVNPVTPDTGQGLALESPTVMLFAERGSQNPSAPGITNQTIVRSSITRRQ